MDMSDLYQLGRRLTELAYQGMGADRLGLTPSEFLVLRDLYMNGESAIGDVVGRTGLAQSRVSTAVATLRDRGWVATKADPADGRKTLAGVTDSVRVEGDSRRAGGADPVLAAVLADAEPGERAQLAAALARLHELLVAPQRGAPVRTLRSGAAE
jgi:MarR family 2-MHQ and catechol resistance regulon transcriptional repressor